MLKKSIRMEDLGKIKKDLLDTLEDLLEWPEHFGADADIIVTDTLLEFFEVGVLFNEKEKTKISRSRVMEVAVRIFDNFRDYPLPLDEVYWADYKTFAKAYERIYYVFSKHTEIVDSDDVGDIEPGQEPGASY